MILVKILLLISFAFILVCLLLARDDRPNHAPIQRLNDQTNRPDNCSGVFSKCDKNNTLKLDNYNKKQKLSELRKNGKNELNKKLLSNNNLMLYGNSLESNIGNCNLTRPPNKDFYFGYVKFIKNTLSKYSFTVVFIFYFVLLFIKSIMNTKFAISMRAC